MAGSYVNSMFSCFFVFEKTKHTVSHGGCTIFRPQGNENGRVLISPRPLQHLLVCFLEILTRLELLYLRDQEAKT